MQNKNIFKYLFILSILIISGCPNPMIGLGDKVDIDSPTISIGEYGDGSDITNGDYVRGAITLTGSVQDDIGIKSVQVSFDKGTSFLDAVVSEDGKSWSYLLDTSLYEDGEEDIIVLVSDTSPTPKTSEERLLLYFDNTPPVVVVKNPSGYASGSFSDSVINLKGEAADPLRVRKVEVEVLTGSGELGTIEGTNSWSVVFTSEGTGAYTFKVTAEDYAGNRSTHFYHYDDILTQNGNVFITPEDIYKVENGEAVSNLIQSELIGDDGNGGIALESVTYNIDMSADEPVIIISNPDPSASPDENILPGNSKAIGSVTDDDAVNDSSIAISLDGGDFISVTSTDGSGQFVRWEHDLSALDSGAHTLQLYSKDVYGVSKKSSIVNFFINLGAPEISITSPSMGDYKNTGSFTITGTAHDGESVTQIKISTDGGTTWNDPTLSDGPGADISWSYDTPNLADGVIPIKVKAFDGTSWSFSNLQVTVDTEAPVTSFYSPSKDSFVNGEVVIRGASSDNNSLLKTEIKVGDSRSWQIIPEEEKYNWACTINSLEYENSSDAVETPADSGIYKLTVYSRVTDIAGNVTTTSADDYWFNIDNALDRPTVNIIAPSNNANLGGSVIVSGTSYDDDGEVYGVYMQIDVNTHDGDTPNFSDSVTLSDPIDFDGAGGNDPVGTITESNWYPLGGKNPWSVELNTNGELYNTESGHTGDIYIRVHAKDKDGGATSSITGEYKEIHIRMDNTVPYIENITPGTNSYENGIFNISGSVVDETQIKHLEISYNGGANYHYIIKDNYIQSGYSGSGSVTTNYTLDLDVDTSAIPDVGSVTSDDITIRLKVTDSTNYQTLYSLHYYIDNQDPTGGITPNLSDINGTSFTVQGTATDSGAVSGIDKVEVHFERDGSVIDIPGDSDKIIIDNKDEFGNDSGGNGDGDGFNESLTISGGDYSWWAEFNSTEIPDGPVEVHFIIFDISGNEKSYMETGYIKNHKPEIESITLGTDLNGNGEIDGSEKSTFLPADFSATNFTGRNDQLKISINLVAGTGNDPLSYSVTYDGGSNLITSDSDALINMSDHAIYADVSENGAAFVCTITDDAGLLTTETIYLNIDNVDDIPPTIELGVLDVNNSVPETDGEKDGHLEERSWTKYDNGADNPGDSGNDVSDDDPDISGKILFNGSAYDNQRIQKLYIWIDLNNDGDFNDTDEKILIADEDVDGSLKNVNGNIITETLTELGGHNVDFTYEWDSATLVNTTGNNIKIKLVAEDYNSTPNSNVEYSYPTSDYNLMTVDVVPYIKNINSRLSSGFSANPSVIDRSANGLYPVSRDEIIKVYVFNIDNTSTSTINGAGVSTSYASDENGEYLDVTITSGATSGELKISTNSIISINNLNNNNSNSSGYMYNHEPNGVNNDLLTDDRFLTVWNFSNIADTDTARYPVMRISPGGNPSFSYADAETNFRMILDDGTITNFETNYTRYNYTNLGFDDNGNIYGVALNSDRISDTYDGSSRFGFFYTEAGNKSTGSKDGYNNGTFKRHIEHNWNGTVYNSLRTQYPDLVVFGSGTSTDPAKIYIVYYDDSNKELKFRYGEISGQKNSDISGAIAEDYDDGNNGTEGSLAGYHIIESLSDDDDVVADGVQSFINPGQYSSIGVTSGGVAVVAWYDVTERRLLYSYNTDPSNATESQWNENYMVLDDSFAGQFVDIAVDGEDAIHIAYYNSSSGDLKYGYLSSYSDTTVEIVVVDSFLSVGQKLMIDTRLENSEYIPYISYSSSAYAGTQHSLRIASKSPGISLSSGAIADKYTQNWEIMTIPTGNIPKDYIVSVGFLSGRVIVGYATDVGLEYAELY